MVKALIIPVDGEPFVAENHGELGFMEIRDIIGGHFAAIQGDGWHAYLDEEGQPKRLPINTKATAFLRAHGWRGTYALGTVVIFGDSPDGEEGDVPAELVQIITS